jgi:uncharacterized SAM-binding protein YcdF (DUF218 family)
MQCLRRCLLVFLAVCAGLAGAAAGAAYYAARWLNDPDAPEKAGAIVLLGGDSTRALEAADLYRAGLAPRIYLSVPIREPRERLLDAIGVVLPREEDTLRRILGLRGVPDGAVDLLGRDMVTTVQEAKTAAERLAGVADPVIVVTSPYHLRRARMIFRHELPGRRLLFVASHYESFPEAWWTDQTAARSVVLELAKTAYYVAGGRF